MKTSQREFNLIKYIGNGRIRITDYGDVYKFNNKEYVKVAKINKGYVHIRVRNGEVRYECLAHRLVYIYFYGYIPPGMVINHIDHNKLNNHPFNLELTTDAGNMKHAYLSDDAPKGEKNPQSKLCVEEVKAIRWLYNNGGSNLRLANMFGISLSCINSIVYKNTWKHLDDDISSIGVNIVLKKFNCEIKDSKRVRKEPDKYLLLSIINLIIYGNSNKQISKKLGISFNTVRLYRKKYIKKKRLK